MRRGELDLKQHAQPVDRPFDREARKAPQPPRPQPGLRSLTPGGRILEIFPLEAQRGLRLVGELCLATVDELLAALEALPEGADTVDLGDLSFMDSSGLHAFEQYARRLAPRPLVIQNPSPQVRRLFELTGTHLNPEFDLQASGENG